MNESHFKDTINREVSYVFLNTSEYGELIEIDGQDGVPAVYEQLEIQQEITEERRAVSYEGVTIYVNRKDCPDTLLPGRETTFNKERWFVLESTDCESMRIIKLYRERA